MHLRLPILVPTTVATLIAAVALTATGPLVTRPPVTTLTVTGLGATLPVTAAGPQPLSPAGANPASLDEAAAGTNTITNTPRATPTVTPGAVLAAEKPALTFVWPLSPHPAIHRRFERPADDWARGHRGVDLLAAVGQPVLSPGEGIIAFSGVVAGRGVITVRHSGGLRTTYEPVDDRLASGTLVHQGSRIGSVSPAAGHCMPLTCLHWGAISGQTYRDPLSLLRFSPPVLLPIG